MKLFTYHTSFIQAKKKVALLLQKLKKYELPELPAPRHDPELLTAEQLQAYKKIGFRNRNYVPVGVRGVFGGVVQNMHMHWKFHETVQVCCDNFPKEKIKEMAAMLTRLSGGIVINIHNTKTIIMFRGRNYRQPKNLIPFNTLTKRKVSPTLMCLSVSISLLFSFHFPLVLELCI
jgi:RNA-binding protein YhbY